MADMADDHTKKKLRVSHSDDTQEIGEGIPKATFDWKKTPSFPPTEGSCIVWLPRKQRYCSHHATIGSTKCTTHANLDNVPKSKEPNILTKETEAQPAIVNSRKTNLDRHLKRMLNPFSIPPMKESPQWSTLYLNPNLPLCIDIGCSKGLYIRDYRDKQTMEWNFLGVEIFEPYVIAANAAEKQRQAESETAPRNLAYIHANINNSLETLTSNQSIARVSLLFPDPWGCGQNKEHKNKKRRVMTPDFAERLVAVMPIGSEFYLASDYEDLALDIRANLLATKGFAIPTTDPFIPTMTAEDIRSLYNQKDVHKHRLIDTSKGVGKVASTSDNENLWLKSIPLGVPTERDIICENQWRPVYRLVLVRV